MRTTFSLLGGRSVAPDQQQQQQQQSEHQRQQSQQDPQLRHVQRHLGPQAGPRADDHRQGRHAAANSKLTELADIDCFES